ncbi:phosphate regulon transcriptional regulatory protein PhoB [Thiosulfatimonas sediminis]|uniref:Phosphate regulon transcriptional regulatory protein PhoB n=1 Tax=Thiosulfatimonas sediminis TaxID=2675054 RepID=A0A6F8PTP1_9GAMM|nr:phosphate regulon transcriptional regulator PhoB [Thiosulfatimonas sediminis]BBP45350.1 phosphate regulon transcriptional regulatory protein PhoB [Thiosulfatimonas sediminis]
MSQKTILVVEDEAAIRDMLKFTLVSSGFRVEEAGNAELGMRLALEKKPDLILLDWMLPGISGITMAQKLRQHEATIHLPIIMLTARGEEEAQVQGFDAGVDDYVVKPFSPRALVARVNALLRRQKGSSGQNDDKHRIAGRMCLDIESHRFYVDGNEVKLGPTEFKLVNFFISHSDRVFSRAQLLDQVWGLNVVVEERTVDVHIRRLRKLLEPIGVADYIQTIRGSGYRFSAVEA